MTAGILLQLGNTANKWPQLQISQYRQIRNLRKFGISVKKSKFSSPNVDVELEKIQSSKLWKHLGFTVLFGGTSIVGAAIWEYENSRQEMYRILNYYKQIQINRTGWRAKMETWWRNLTEGQRVFVPILFLNTIVFLAWRVPAFQKTMVRYFCSNPASSVSCWPMVFSTFSHYNIFHLAANMFVLHSFSSLIVSTLGKEQFVALYLSSGVVSNFVSYIYKTILKLPVMSLGASGAVLGVIGFTSTEYPTMPLYLIFLPMFTFSAGATIKTLLVIDTIGCIARWKWIDHAGHIGGTLFGIFWQVWGRNIWDHRKPILTLWHEFREPRRSQ
ncbi:presenilins-associated rhomboid-like protein, mitochondrial isoform X2 [Harpegnathos saltator]|uniref:presenilins-associated rhomboid-like protein, mitochondrial isoform X2 n=1 Tax=Harpegnathos saltator TaxID=610380 RepID=UPI00058E0AE7|nr:presenilins-associated rhomboid-like protein, mitochondrial isoform X2 [Harpegnathos saltator]